MLEENNLPAEQVSAAAASTTASILRFLGISPPSGSSDVAGALITETGADIIRDSSLPSAVANAKLDKAVEAASQDFLQEYKTSMAAPNDAISERFANLETSGRRVIVTPRVPKEAVTTLHNHLKQIDSAYLPSIMLKADMKKVPTLVSFIDSHCVTTPYSFSIQKCDKVECCGIIRTPLEVKDLAMQRQPTPRSDPNRPGHFFRRDQALAAAVNNPNALSDLSEMPSNAGDKKKELNKKHKERDAKLTKELILKSWDGKKVRAFLICYHCGKRRCIYTGKEEGYLAAKVALRQKMESVSDRFSCGDLLFDNDHPLSKVIVQKQSLTCESPIEKGYYNCEERALKLKDICIHCGEKGAADFLFSLPQLQQKNMTDGYNCFPICVTRLEKGKKVVKGNKKNAIQARKERDARAASSGN